jgi:hypothetical protein
LPKFHLFNKHRDQVAEGKSGAYPEFLLEPLKGKTEVKHPINESLTRPWLKHFFLTYAIHETNNPDDIIARDKNLVEVFKTTIPLTENSFTESALASWKMLIDSAFREADTPWYHGLRKMLAQERLYSAIEQLELEPPASNPQHQLQFYDHDHTLRKISRIPIKLFFSLPGNEKEIIIEILRHAVNNNPHNLDVAILTYCFLKAWDRPMDFLELARTENRSDLEEWYYWVENDLHSLGALKRDTRDYATLFFIYDRAQLSGEEYKELADWLLKESEFKSAYHFYCKAKEYETALELLQNISVREFIHLVNQRRVAKNEKQIDPLGDPERFQALYQEEVETLRGFARIRAAEMYRKVTAQARQHFDRETIETKYAFGELSDDEYNRLIKQLQERKQ